MLDPVRERCAAFHLASHLLLHPLCFSFPDLGGTLTPTCIGKPPTRALGSAASTDSVLGRCSLGPLPFPARCRAPPVRSGRCGACGSCGAQQLVARAVAGSPKNAQKQGKYTWYFQILLEGSNAASCPQ